MLTIGQLASYAGVTIRAVRHYHQIGLLLEPDRDASGYRTYDAAAVVRLIRIRTLAEAGVPLTRRRTTPRPPRSTGSYVRRSARCRSTAGGSRSWAAVIRWLFRKRWSTTWTACVPPERRRRSSTASETPGS